MVLCLVAQVGVGSLGQKSRKPSTGAQFRACHQKWGGRTIGEGGGMVHMRWCWWGGAAFGRASGGGGLRPKKSKPKPQWLSFGYGYELWVMGVGFFGS